MGDIPKTRNEKIDHIDRCEFHRWTKDGECPWVSNKERDALFLDKENKNE